MKNYCHYAAKALPGSRLFADDKSRIAACNRAGTILHSFSQNVSILAFCFTDTELHFLLRGKKRLCDEFMEKFRMATERWTRNHPGHGTWLRVWRMYCVALEDGVRLRETVAYIHRIPIKRGLNVQASSYAWSSGGLIFSDSSYVVRFCREASTLSLRESRRILCSHTIVPGNWLVLNGKEMLWPGSYVDVKRVERLFSGKAEEYQKLLGSEVEVSIEEEMAAGNSGLTDAQIRALAKDISRRKFGTDRIIDLDMQQKRRLARMLKKYTGAEAGRIRRISRLRTPE